MDKDGLLNQLYTLRGLYRLGMATTCLLAHKQAPSILKESYIVVNEKEKIDFEHLIKYLEATKTKPEVIRHNINIFLRSILLNSFELVKEYCKKEKKHQLLKQQPWYEIVRIIRNGLGHDLKYDLSRYDDEKFPMKIRELKITKDMHGKPIKLDLVQGTNLSTDMILFVKNHL